MSLNLKVFYCIPSSYLMFVLIRITLYFDGKKNIVLIIVVCEGSGPDGNSRFHSSTGQEPRGRGSLGKP